jgi:hypothetical protein
MHLRILLPRLRANNKAPGTSRFSYHCIHITTDASFVGNGPDQRRRLMTPSYDSFYSSLIFPSGYKAKLSRNFFPSLTLYSRDYYVTIAGVVISIMLLICTSSILIRWTILVSQAFIQSQMFCHPKDYIISYSDQVWFPS